MHSLKKYSLIAGLLALVATVAYAASDRLSNNVLIGQSTVATKTITYDVGSGASNPTISGLTTNNINIKGPNSPSTETLRLTATGTNDQLQFGVDANTRRSWIRSVRTGTGENDLYMQANGGNVGIGTIVPGAPLEVDADSATLTTNIITKNAHAGGGEFLVQLFAGTSGSLVAGDAMLSNTVGNLVLTPNATGKSVEFIGGAFSNAPNMTIQDGGGVGIGTSTNTGILDVVSDSATQNNPLNLRNSHAGGGKLLVQLFATSAGSLVAGDALVSNSVGNLFLSPNIAGKGVSIVGGAFSNTPSITVSGTGATTVTGTGGNVAHACARVTASCSSVDNCSKACTAGQIVTGGGCSEGVGSIAMVANFPSGSATWQCNWASAPAATVAYAICCDN